MYALILGGAQLHVTNHNKHDTSTQCWVNAGPSSTTLNQHWVDVSCLLGIIRGFDIQVTLRVIGEYI